MRSAVTKRLLVGSASVLLAFGIARAQDENPTTPGAIPNPGTYQGSMELQRRSDEQDQQFRQQQQYQQPRYNSQPSTQPRRGPEPRGRSPVDQYTSRRGADTQAFGKDSPGDLAASAALHRGDVAGAIRIWRPLVTAGDINAQYNMAVLYEQGHGVPKNPALAASLYRMAADRGMPAAMVNLAGLLAVNARAPADLVPAYKWLAIAATHSTDIQVRTNAEHNMGLMAPLMSPRQIALADGQARAWRGR